MYKSDMYPYQSFSHIKNVFEADVSDEFPQYKTVPAVECILNEGEILHIPKDWYHHVVSQTAVSISVNYFYQIQ